MAFVIPALSAIGTAVGASAASAAAVGATVATAAVSTLGVAASALASSNAAKFQSRLAGSQAKQAQDQASLRASEVARNTRQRLAANRAGAAQNGFELTGSMNDLLDQSARQGELDYLSAVYDGSVTATGLNATSRNYKRQSANALIGGALGAASSALQGVSGVYRARGAAINVGGT